MSDADFYGCYWPDHSQALNMTACNAGATASWCCAMNDICLDNGYCLQTSGPWNNRLGRGACTDNTWSSNACPSMCSDVSMSGATGLYLAYDKPGGDFCCKFNYDTQTKQCANGTKGSTDPFKLPSGNVIYNRTSGATLIGTLTAKQLGINNSTSQLSSTASTSNSSAPAASEKSSSVTPVALGIAIPLSLLLLAAIIGCVYLFMQNQKLRKTLSQSMEHKRPSDASEYTESKVMSPVSRTDHVMPPEKDVSMNWQGDRSTHHSTMSRGTSHSEKSPHTYAREYYTTSTTSEPDSKVHELSPRSINELPADNASPVPGSRPKW